MSKKPSTIMALIDKIAEDSEILIEPKCHPHGWTELHTHEELFYEMRKEFSYDNIAVVSVNSRGNVAEIEFHSGNVKSQLTYMPRAPHDSIDKWWRPSIRRAMRILELK